MNISVVIPLYNKESYIERALLSVINQRTKPDEIIVIDDGSTDKSVQVVENLADKRIILIQQQNFGQSAARNRGLKEARNGIVAFLDADDEWKPDFLLIIKRLIRNFPDCGIYATGYEAVRGNGMIEHVYHTEIPPEPWIGILPNYFKMSLKKRPFNSSSVAVNKKLCLNEGGFPIGVKRGEDTVVWVRMALKYPIAFAPSPQVRYYPDALNSASKVISPLIGKNYLDLIEIFLLNDQYNPKLSNSLINYYSARLIDMMLNYRAWGDKHQSDELLNKLKNLPKKKMLWLRWRIITILPYKYIKWLLSIKKTLISETKI